MVIRRSAGVRTRQPTGGRAGGRGPDGRPGLLPRWRAHGARTGPALRHRPAGRPARGQQPAATCRELTRRIADLAENSAQSEGIVRPPQVRFLWGKAWNIPAVVLAVAKRYENFTSAGDPRRSWLRIRLLRVSDRLARTGAPARPAQLTGLVETQPSGASGEAVATHQQLDLGGAGPVPPATGPAAPADPSALLSDALERHASAAGGASTGGRGSDCARQNSC